MPVVSVEKFTSTSFDYLIVGGGTAGLVVAARLSEDPAIKVGVLEAGEFLLNKPEICIPGYFGRAIGNPTLDWSYASIRQSGLEERAIFQPRGKGLGGTSNLNFMAAGRGSSVEYDAFEKLGNPGWNWKSFLHYFKKSEGLTDPSSNYKLAQGLIVDPEYHGLDGPVKQTYPLWHSNLHPLFLLSCQNAGLDMNSDLANGSNVGVSTMVHTVDPKTATRTSSCTAYLEPCLERSNLLVLTEAHVTRVVFNTNSIELVAEGVEFLHQDKQYMVAAEKEVVLSAGSFQTPQLLELSGIGKKEYTTQFNIKQLIDLPGVGENLQDHLRISNVFEVQKHFETLEVLFDPEQQAALLELYTTKQEGMLTVPVTAWAFAPSQKIMNDETIQAIRCQYIKTIENTAEPGLRKQFEHQLEWFNDSTQSQSEIIHTTGMLFGSGIPELGKRYQTLISVLLHPLSRGNVHISSPNPLSRPVINPQYLSNPVDLELLAATSKYACKLSETEPFKSATIAAVNPGPDVQSDEALVAYIKKNCESIYHPIGTASMLPREENGVVNPRLVVYGTKNLRVVDASVIPIMISNHIVLTVYAIAEKAADMIKEDNS